jgi:hypothetical protein
MSHASEGKLQAYLDGELTAAERSTVGSHVESCAQCAADLQSLKNVNAEVHAALALIEHPVPAAKAPSARPIEFAPKRRSLVREIPRQFLRAAVVLLAIAGVVSAAIPGSPLFRWIADFLTDEPEVPVVQPPTPAPAPSTTASAPAEPNFIELEPTNDRIRVSLISPSPDMELHVVQVDAQGRIIFDEKSASNQWGKSQDQYTVNKVGPGILTIRIPRSVATASVEVDGKTWWIREGGVLRTDGPVYSQQGDTEVVFRTRS